MLVETYKNIIYIERKEISIEDVIYVDNSLLNNNKELSKLKLRYSMKVEELEKETIPFKKEILKEELTELQEKILDLLEKECNKIEHMEDLDLEISKFKSTFNNCIALYERKILDNNKLRGKEYEIFYG